MRVMMSSIHSDLIRGHIDTIILSVLHDGDRYGYDILGEIEKKSGGEYALKQPTLYSCLKRLESQGFIYKYWGTETNGGRRTYYSLTEMGKELFRKNKDDWVYSREVINKLIDTPDGYIPAPPTEQKRDRIAEAEVTEIPDGEEIDLVDEEEYEEELALQAESEKETEKEPEEAPEEEIDEEVAAVDTSDVTEAVAEPEAMNDAYADVIASAEAEAMTRNDAVDTYSDALVQGYCYADKQSDESVPDDDSNMFSSSLFAEDYSEDFDEEDDASAYVKDGRDISTVEPPAYTYTDGSERSIFRSYNDPTLSETAEREITVNREYRKVIRELLDGKTNEEYAAMLASEDESAYYVPPTPAPPPSEPVPSPVAPVTAEPPSDFSSRFAAKEAKYDEYAEPIRKEKAAKYLGDAAKPADGEKRDKVNFDELTMAVRSMGDDVRIRTHNSETQKAYSNVYQYYSNKLALYKYGILFAIMLLEILIPYLIIKFGAHLHIWGELPFLIVFVVFAAVFPVYSAIAFLNDPYKRKRYNYNMKTSLLYRTGIMFLLFVLVYTGNVVFMMDVAFDVYHLFSLITPALMATNVPLSSLLFKSLYDSGKFAVTD